MSGKNNKHSLAIESAVADGSVALICNGGERVVTKHGEGCSRAEKLILVITDLVREANLTLADLDTIAVSVGPGSYSGIRIGLSTALGLSHALNIPCVGVSVLDSLSFAAAPAETVIAAVPVGKNDVAWQPFEVKEGGARSTLAVPRLLPAASFVNELERHPGAALFAQTDLLKNLTDRLPDSTPTFDAGVGLAEFVGRFALSAPTSDTRLRPIYLSNREPIVASSSI